MAQAPVKRWLATASDDNSVRIWDLVGGQCLHIYIHRHSSMTTELRYPTIEEIKSLPEDMRHIGGVPFKGKQGEECAFSADEKLLAYG